jgi:peptidoglycan biosynthesis protein MviN/MurJ (putative lipid II flippase)
MNSRNGILTALNKLDMLVQFTALDFVTTVMTLFLFHQFGIEVMLMASGLSALISIAVALPFLLRQMHVSARELLQALLPPYLAAAIMCGGVLVLQMQLPDLQPLEGLLLKAVVGATLYIGTLMILFRRWALDTVKSLMN